MLTTLSPMIKRKNVRRPKFVKLQPHEIFRLLFWLAFKPSLPPYLRAVWITYCELRWSICQMFLLSLIQKNYVAVTVIVCWLNYKFGLIILIILNGRVMNSESSWALSRTALNHLHFSYFKFKDSNKFVPKKRYLEAYNSFWLMFSFKKHDT